MSDCIFCKIVNKEIPSHTVYEDERFMAFLDIHPQSRGHLLLIPKKHYRWVYDMEEIGEFFTCAQSIIRGIISPLGAHHIRLFTLGEEVPHAHLHIVPQYNAIGKSFNEKMSGMGDKEEITRVAELLRQK